MKDVPWSFVKFWSSCWTVDVVSRCVFLLLLFIWSCCVTNTRLNQRPRLWIFPRSSEELFFFFWCVWLVTYFSSSFFTLMTPPSFGGVLLFNHQISSPSSFMGQEAKRFRCYKHIQNMDYPEGLRSSAGSLRLCHWNKQTRTCSTKNWGRGRCLHESSVPACFFTLVLLWNIILLSSGGSTPPDCYFIQRKRVHRSNLLFLKLTENQEKYQLKFLWISEKKQKTKGRVTQPLSSFCGIFTYEILGFVIHVWHMSFKLVSRVRHLSMSRVSPHGSLREFGFELFNIFDWLRITQFMHSLCISYAIMTWIIRNCVSYYISRLKLRNWHSNH